MGSATDPIYVTVSTHTQSPDGTTRNESFFMTATLNAYAVQLANNIATPVYNLVMAEQIAAGGARTATPFIAGMAAGGPVSLRAEVGVGVQALATPLRYHLVRYDNVATPITTSLATGGQFIYNWVDGLLQILKPMNLYPGFNTP